MEMPSLTACSKHESRPLFKDPTAGVVEVSLLLPTQRAEALIDLARRRRQSVGQILRGMVDEVLADDEERFR